MKPSIARDTTKSYAILVGESGLVSVRFAEFGYGREPLFFASKEAAPEWVKSAISNGTKNNHGQFFVPALLKSVSHFRLSEHLLDAKTYPPPPAAATATNSPKPPHAPT